jgi:hypothetical protein
MILDLKLKDKCIIEINPPNGWIYYEVNQRFILLLYLGASL